MTYRHPGLLAKIATTLDVLSGGRAFLGIGAAWYEREHSRSACRTRRCRSASSGSRRRSRSCCRCGATTRGRTRASTTSSPRRSACRSPIQRPHPPIVIGGGGEKKTLRLVAKYADACNLNVTTSTRSRHKLDVLRAHCEPRAATTIDREDHAGRADRRGRGSGCVPPLAEQLAALGIEHIQLRTQTDDPAGYVARAGELIADRMAAIEPATP